MVKPGDIVKWTSQSQGSWVTKQGEVVAVVKPLESAFRHLPADLPKARRKFESDRVHAWYGIRALVKVPRVSKRDGSVLGYDYYCPRLSQVEVVEDGGDHGPDPAA
ncbi:hypothetical protein [Alicyclobacillus macrosporangiidus]|uniref:Uncharacterized protein n=1 Tax=Alicyclobacillus macrosporangiidus TaxID=392015 RepID=A0A1I7IC38_9BACL|nr:hypothetical protein [Alicyclobacillus macrosporangiidus]SFU70543.1 hypothetical protein SAMN05421543_106127 [Alicyclobacillus macrosporangiidus]